MIEPTGYAHRYPHIDMAILKNCGDLVDGKHGKSLLKINGRTIWGVSWIVSLKRIGVYYNVNNEPYKHVLEFSHGNGVSNFVLCPCCGFKCKKVFFNRSKAGCRVCMAVKYPSQYKGELGLKLRRLKRLLSNHTDTTNRKTIYDPPARLPNQRLTIFKRHEAEIKSLQRDVLYSFISICGIPVPKNTDRLPPP